MTTIELGDLSTTDGGRSDGPVIRLDRRLVRRLALAGAALLCLFAVTASARPAPPQGIRPLWQTALSELDGVTLGADTAYLQRNEGTGTRLTAYDLATGAIRWEQQLTESVSYVQLAEKAGLLLLPSDRQGVAIAPGSTRGEFSKTTVALDARTGERRWSTRGEPHLITADTVLLAEYTETGQYARLNVVRLSDRQTVWARAIPGVSSMTWSLNAEEQPERLVTATMDGTIEVLRYADGSRVARARVDWVRTDPEHNWSNDLSAGHGFLAVNRNQNTHAEVSVYRLDTLDELWRTDNTNGYAFACGAALCLNGPTGLVAYDPETGRERWRLGAGINGWDAGAGRLIVSNAGDSGDNAVLGMIDATGGRVVGESLRGQPVFTTMPVGYVLVMRSTQEPPGRTSVTRWDLRTGHARLLGSLDLATGLPCQTVPGYLACQRAHDYQVTATGR